MLRQIYRYYSLAGFLLLLESLSLFSFPLLFVKDFMMIPSDIEKDDPIDRRFEIKWGGPHDLEDPKALPTWRK